MQGHRRKTAGGRLGAQPPAFAASSKAQHQNKRHKLHLNCGDQSDFAHFFGIWVKLNELF